MVLEEEDWEEGSGSGNDIDSGCANGTVTGGIEIVVEASSVQIPQLLLLVLPDGVPPL